MSRVFIGHLGLGQAQDGDPIRLQHLFPLYLQALDKLALSRNLFRGRARIFAALPPSQAIKPQEIPQFPQERGRDLRRSCTFRGVPSEPCL
ncbi:hypothetical protein RHMOL_Rhmol08G0184900 [Rhododendron molle]|uniref:Uncharacterized protein n=1 Tax=Rhododendron molle TaxID=49168 RepID=A0ACC0MR64_RHOML|nr:hypothetical protein RHMOL_Rhmol08G0184900 [Rhododendron molle]